MSTAAFGATDPVQRILDRVEHVRSGAGWSAICPAHPDRHKSLSINRGDNYQALIFCHAGCEASDVMGALGLRLADLYADGKDRPAGRWLVSGKPVNGARPAQLTAVPPPTPERKAPRATLGLVVARYAYRDERGTELFAKLRYEPKDFRIKRPNGSWGLGDARRVMYRLPELLVAGRAGETVYLVEGEKDADRLAGMGLSATCNFDGGQVA